MTTTDAEMLERLRTERPQIVPGPQIHAAIPAILADLHGVGKTEWNPQQNYAYTGIESIKAALRPLLGKHGVYYRPRTLEISRDTRTTKGGGTLWVVHLHLELTFVARDGSSLVCDAWSEGTDSADKAVSKAYTGAEKVILRQLFCVAGGQEDPDAGGEESLPAQQDWFVENGWESQVQHDEWRAKAIASMRDDPAKRKRFTDWRVKKGIEAFVDQPRHPMEVAGQIQAWIEEDTCPHLDTDEVDGRRFCLACHETV